MKHWFEDVKTIQGIDRLVRVIVLGVPVHVAQGGSLIEELEYGKYPGVRDHSEVVAKHVVADVETGRALVLDAKICSGNSRHLPFSVSVVQESNLRSIHD